jgi:hypothetical protein
MNNFFGQLRQKLSKPLLFGLYGAVGCLGAATLFGEVFLLLTKLPPTVERSPLAILLLISHRHMTPRIMPTNQDVEQSQVSPCQTRI